MTNRAFFTISSLVAMVACGGQVTSLGSIGDETEPTTNGAGADPAKSESQGTSGGNDSAIDAGSADGGSSGGGSGKACNPFVASPSSACPSGEYCEADVPGSCGIGKCVTNPPPPPPFCPSMECGCDGKLKCAGGSRPSGFDVGSNQCGFACGNTTCNGVTEFCEHAAGGVMLPDGGANEWWTCKPIPAACVANRSCACITQNAMGGYVCESEKDQKVTVLAPLP
jgi:hypothetical protein